MGFAQWGDANCSIKQRQHLLICSKGTRGSDLSSLQPPQPAQPRRGVQFLLLFPPSQVLWGVAARGLTAARVLPTFTIIYSAELDTFQTSYYTTVCSNTNICGGVQQQSFRELFHRLQKPHISLPRTEQPHRRSGN